MQSRRSRIHPSNAQLGECGADRLGASESRTRRGIVLRVEEAILVVGVAVALVEPVVGAAQGVHVNICARGSDEEEQGCLHEHAGWSRPHSELDVERGVGLSPCFSWIFMNSLVKSNAAM